jgi:CheY-like chemotaxis protein
VALVLAVDPDRRQGKALDRLTTELDGHEVVVASSANEAVALINHRMPDLVLFPLLLTPADEEALTSRLRSLPGADAVHTLTIPLLASEESDPDAHVEDKPRWFYWFRPREESTTAPPCEPRVFAEEIRTYLEAARSPGNEPQERHGATEPPRAATTVTESVTANPTPTDISHAPPHESFPVSDAADVITRPTGSLFNLRESETSQQASPQSDGPSPATSPLRPALKSAGTLVLAGARRGTTATGRAVAAAWPYVNLAARLPVAGSRRGWYAATSLVASAGIVIATGLPARVNFFAAPTTGVVALESSPPGSDVFVDGKKVGVTPLMAPLGAGQHDVEFRFRGQTRTLPLQIAAGESTLLRVDWKRVASTGRRNAKAKTGEADNRPSATSGWVALVAPVDLLVVYEGQTVRPDLQNRIVLPPGRHELHFTNESLGYETTQVVDVQPGVTIPISIVLPKTTITVTATSSAEVWIDGVKAGETPLIEVPVEIGAREIVLKHPTFGERRVSTTATVKPLRIDIDFSKPEA